MAAVDWDEAAAKIASLEAAEKWRLQEIELEREAQRSGVTFVEWRNPKIAAVKWRAIATSWRFIRAGKRGDPYAEDIASRSRQCGYVDAPPGIQFAGDLEPDKMIYLAIHNQAYAEHVLDRERKHRDRLDALVHGGRKRFVESAVGQGAEVTAHSSHRQERVLVPIEHDNPKPTVQRSRS